MDNTNTNTNINANTNVNNANNAVSNNTTDKIQVQNQAKQTTVDFAVMERFLNSYQIFSLEMISIFCNLKRTSANKQQATKSSDEHLTITDEIKILNLIIKIIKNVDLDIEAFIDLIRNELKNKQFKKVFDLKMGNLTKDTLNEIRSLISDLKIHFIMQSNNDALIKPWSIVGRYVRRCIIIYEKLTFDKLNTLCKKIATNLKFFTHLHFDDWMEVSGVGGVIGGGDDDLESSILLTNLIGQPDKCSTIFKATNAMNGKKQLDKQPESKSKPIANNQIKQLSEKFNNNILSRKMAEYFVSQQAFLIENNDYECLEPIGLQKKLDFILKYDPQFNDIFYLKYLNIMRLNDYTLALKYLHDYFDRFIVNGSVSLAALNLTSLEYRFDNVDNAYQSLKEAITSAHQENDNVKCLQYCLNWLYKLNATSANDDKEIVICKNSCSKALSYDLFDLASYNLNYFSRYNIGVYKPSVLLDLLNKIDLINIKSNSKIELTLLNKCHKAAMWSRYGNKRISDLYCQLLLNLLPPKSSLYKLNTESQLISMCYLAINYADSGHFDTSQNIIDMSKTYYSKNLKFYSQHFLYTDNLILIKKFVLNGQWANAKVCIERLASTNMAKALIEQMNMNILEGLFVFFCFFKSFKSLYIYLFLYLVLALGNLDKACEIGETLLEASSTTVGTTNGNDNNNRNQEEIFINLWSNRIKINIKQGEYSNALISAIKLYYQIKQLDFNYELNACSVLIARILIEMKYPQQAIKYLEKSFVYVLSCGTLLDQAKLHFLYSKCLFMLNGNMNDRHSLSVNHMYQCIDKLENAQAYIYLKDAYSFLCLLLNFAGLYTERNKYSLKYRLLSKQFPFVGFLL